MSRLQLFGAAIAAGISLWIVMDSRSFLYAFLVTFFLCMAGVGIGTIMRGTSRECPPVTYSEDDLEWIESHKRFLAALDDATRRTP